MSRFARLHEIKPDEAGPAEVRSEEIAERLGFKSREPVERIYKLDPTKEATVPLSIRPPLSVANRFVSWCKANRFSYWEGLNELMRHRGI